MSDRFDDQNDIFTDPDAGKDTRDPFTSTEEEHKTVFETAPETDSAQKTPAEEIPAQPEATVDETLKEEPQSASSGEKIPAEESAGLEEDPDRESSAEEKPAEEKPAEGIPAEEKPAEEKPAEGLSGEDGPADPEKTDKKAEAEHDFDDEPKFDTQTGQPLDKPKSKVPGILLTLAVTAGVAGAITAAFMNRDDWANGTAAEVETEEAFLTIPDQTEGTTESETGETDISAQSEAQTEQQTKGQTEAAALQEGKQTEELTETETESMTETAAEDGTDKKSLSEEFGKNAVSLNTSLDVSGMVKNVLPGVVSVTSQSVRTVESFFYGEQQIKTSNVGSGVIVDEDSDSYYIVTDAYLAARAQDITVGFSASSDERKENAGQKTDTDQAGSEGETEADMPEEAGGPEDEFLRTASGDQEDDTLVSAELVGTDAGTELAVISVKKSDIAKEVQAQLQIAALGDSDSLRIGERVVAIGDSLGYGQSVTQGIVSAKNRTMQSAYGVHDYIQTDASINYGNYGGALLNLHGEVIGINAGKVTEDSAEGMGYALPINDAKAGIRNILNGKGSGLKDAFAPQIDETQSETEGGETVSKPSEETGKAEEPGTESSGRGGLLGVNVFGTDEISEEDKIVYRVPDGLYVASVNAGSGAEAAGLQADDIIMEIDGKRVSTVDELKEALSTTSSGDKVKVGYSRRDKSDKYGETSTVEVTLQ